MCYSQKSTDSFVSGCRFQYLWVAIVSLVFNAWTLRSSNFFMCDDYSWFWFLQHTPFSNYAHWLPTSPYNDRPVGIALLGLFYGIFGLNAQLHHLALLLIHTFSALLFVKVINSFLWNYSPQGYFSDTASAFPSIAGILFSGWSTTTLTPVSWPAAIFDLIGCTLTLLTMFCYLKVQRCRQSNGFAIATVVFYALSLRTKEMTVVIPCMLVLLESWNWLASRRVNVPWTARRLPLLGILIGIMAAYLWRIIYVKSAYPGITDPTHPYFLSHSPSILLRNLWRYVLIYFDPWQDYAFTQFKPFAIAVTTFLAVGCLVLFWLGFKKRSPLALVPALFIIQLMPVLPMQNMQSPLYLYLPSLFLSLLTAALICAIATSHRFLRFAQIPFTILLIAGLYGAGKNEERRTYTLRIGKMNRQLYTNICNMPCPASRTTVYLVNVTPEYAPVCLLGKGAGNGDALRAIYHDESIASEVITDKAESASLLSDPSKCVWNYSNRSLK